MKKYNIEKIHKKENIYIIMILMVVMKQHYIIQKNYII
jgi:hypothetical protein